MTVINALLLAVNRSVLHRMLPVAAVLFEVSGEDALSLRMILTRGVFELSFFACILVSFLQVRILPRYEHLPHLNKPKKS